MLVDHDHPKLSISRQCVLLGLCGVGKTIILNKI